MGTWTNNDGLYIRMGTDEATATLGGEFPTPVAGMHVAEVRITLTGLALTSSVMANTTIIPSGATIHKVEVIAETAATSGGSAALNVGLHRLDRTTAIDADGLVAALALTAIDTLGETSELHKGSTGAGALIGTELTNPGVIVADYDTAAYTAGEALIRVYYYID